ncbi:MAG: MlaD family protein [Ginsengibacter sp.]|jgi:phospholipid/cholesterol/gamma-HCH transport system substrate-binding protein
MRSTNSNRAVIVGIFVVVGLIIMVLTILTLGSQRKTFDKSITVTAFFDNVNGLQKGNNIWFSGVKVGTIKKVYITGKGHVEVDMSISTDARQYIRKDAKAKLSTDGLIGSKIIEIYGGSLKTEEIEEGDILSADIMLSTDDMMNTLAKNNDNFLAISNDLKVITGRISEGKGSIGKLLNDETLADQINATSVMLQKSAKNLEQLTANVSTYTNKLNSKGTLPNDLMNDTIIFNRLRMTVKSLQAVTDSSRIAINNLKIAGNTLNEGLQNKKAPLGMLLSDEQSADKIKGTLNNLQDASKKLDENMEALQHNFLLRGFFKKKAKADQQGMRVVLDTVVSK